MYVLISITLSAAIYIPLSQNHIASNPNKHFSQKKKQSKSITQQKKTLIFFSFSCFFFIVMMYSLVQKTKTCQVCKKSFPTGKALGGHMRSHTRTLSAPNAESATVPTIPTLQQTSNKLGANFKPHETVLVRSIHTNEVGVGPKPDLKSEEGGQQITGKRKILVDLNKVYSPESQCSLTVEEESALCLIEMSKGKRPAYCPSPKSIDPCLVSTRKGKEKYTEKYIQIDSEDDDEDEDVKFLTSDVGILTEDNDEDDEDETYLVAREEKGKKEYDCDICGKVLRSYQALGGHRTSHRNKRLKICEKNDQAVKPENGEVVRRQYGCEICGRVFESGQALGGHKKVHYLFLQPSR